jgi:hypothetical protein
MFVLVLRDDLVHANGTQDAMAVDTRAHLLSPPDKPAASLQSGADFRNVFARSFGEDAPAFTILQNCYRTMGAQGRLLVIECGLPQTPPTPSIFIEVMRRMVSAGRERTVRDYTALLNPAAFAVTTIRPTPALTSLSTGVPV